MTREQLKAALEMWGCDDESGLVTTSPGITGISIHTTGGAMISVPHPASIHPEWVRKVGYDEPSDCLVIKQESGGWRGMQMIPREHISHVEWNEEAASG